MGAIDLDPASCAEANEYVKADKFFTIDDDGLSLPWNGRLWLNPPWSAKVGRPFLTRLDEEYRAGKIASAVIAYNAYTLLTSRWAQFLYAYPLCFPHGERTRFHVSGGQLVKPLHSTVFAYLGPDDDDFTREFSQHGAILKAV